VLVKRWILSDYFSLFLNTVLETTISLSDTVVVKNFTAAKITYEKINNNL
jgi:hypothetical protein